LQTLIIAPQWIGDAVMSEPLLRRLASRGERLSVAALPWVAPVYRAMPQVDQVIDLPFAHGRLDLAKRRQLAAELRGRFDAAYILPNSIKAALIPALARIPQRIGYHGEGRYGLLTERLPNPSGTPPMVTFYAALAGPGADPQARPRLVVDSAVRQAVTQREQLVPGAYWVFAPGAEYGPSKRWPTSHYGALAASLHARHGEPVMLLGSAKEKELCEAIAAAAPEACRVLAGQTSLPDAMALIAAARGVVSNDSGLMHVAAALDIPQAAVFGSTSPLHTPPLNPRARVLWLKGQSDLDCIPCFERTCRYGHTRCLTDIGAQSVARALDDALAASREPAAAG
jgi:heptosyltransferase-2